MDAWEKCEESGRDCNFCSRSQLELEVRAHGGARDGDGGLVGDGDCGLGFVLVSHWKVTGPVVLFVVALYAVLFVVICKLRRNRRRPYFEMELQQNLVSTSAASASYDVDDDDEDETVFSQGQCIVVGKLVCPIGGCSHGEFKKAVNFAKHILQQHYKYGEIKKGK